MSVQRAAVPYRAAAAPQQPVPAAAWDLRVLRAVPFAAVCTLAAAAGHAAASGGPVPAGTLAAGFAAVCVLAALLGGRERSLTAIAGGLVTGQLALHLLFHSARGMAGSAARAGMAGMGGGTGGRSGAAAVAERLLCHEGLAHGAPLLPPGTTPEQLLTRAGLDPSAYAAPSVPWWHAGVLGLSPLMLAGHLAAALAAGWWLRRGEAALWRLVRLAGSAVQDAVRECAAPLRAVLAVAGALLRGLTGASPVRPLRPYGPERGGWRLPGAAPLRHSVVRRGPPAAVHAI
ncbi:hypothetical protein LO771_07730 [Streptacidiphilus sp. ASG 303]|uniref:hypothetical protein n=1 Tax=Streptacidiphilus sp. ASG 303 TaxID=2896847 RepID=UPI001E364B02|nr:hypothetical protein [Streptacidiphilus sp. ASG 303]MCD0482306.1 hypothetical protein [Streptacidiphilus sp. ASG 303]